MDQRLQSLARLAKAGDIDAMRALSRQLNRYAGIANLAEMVTRDDDRAWNAGDQLAALAHYTDGTPIRIVQQHKTRGRRGRCFAVLIVDDGYPMPRVVLWRDSFGSCEGCDALEGTTGNAYVKATLREGNTRQFWSLDEAARYLCDTTDPLWARLAGEMLTMLASEAER